MSTRVTLVRAALCVLLVLLVWGIFTRHNQFPFFYHPDEAGKVEQVLTGNWNFNHPMLLLASTRAALGWQTPSQQQTVVIGRVASALFASCAVLCLALLAYQHAGMTGAFCVALLLALHHQLFELSHYMKEDTALLAGMAFAFFAISLFWSSPTPPKAALLGLACAVALSGKYLGAVMILLALPVLWVRPAEPKTRLRILLLFCAALAAGFVAVNFPFLQLFGKFIASFGREFEMVVHGQSGMSRSIPHSQYWNVFHDNTNPVLLAFLICHVCAFWKTRRNRTLPEWLALLFPFIYAIALSFSPKSNDRYFLPATAMFTYLAGLVTVDAGRWIGKRLRIPTALASGLCILLAVGSQLPSFHRYWNAFQTDDRAALRQWVETNLPTDAVLVIDPRCGLPSPERADDLKRQPPLQQKVLRKKYASDFGSIEELRAQGVTHVIVSQSDYGRFFLKSLRPHDGFREKYNASRLFYERLFKEGRLLWSRERGTVIYLHPGIQVYAL